LKNVNREVEMRKLSFICFLISFVLFAGIESSQGAIKAVVLKSAGSDLPAFWIYLSSNWTIYGPEELFIDYSTLNKDDITYEEIVQTQAQVLIIDDARNPLNSQRFSPEEVSSIIQYVEEGHGLIVTGGTLRPVEHYSFLSLLGFSLQAGGQVYYSLGQPDTIDILELSHPLFASLPTYSTASNSFYSGSDWDNDGDRGYPGDWEYVLVDPAANIVGFLWNSIYGQQEASPICTISKTNYRAVFAGHAPASFSPTSDDCQFYYNMIYWTSSEIPTIELSKSTLNFAATAEQRTSPQEFNITNTGGGHLDWSMTDNANWLSCDPASGSGDARINVSVDPTGLSAGTYNATITVTSPNASNSPQEVTVVLIVHEVGADSPPFGYFDTPIDEAIVSGSLPVTGWALDDIEVTKVEIKRDPDPDDPPEAVGPDGLVLISWPPEGKNNVVFVKGSRTDVEALYPTYPLNDRAGWGYMLLTYGLPRQGNGTFRLYAFAEDATGHRVLLGTKQITSDNANRVQPFGTIDTPDQGEVISGTYINFGWALTPFPKMIPTDGSTVWISIDGVFIANADYNHFRQDIYDSFPGYLNSSGAVGFMYLDSTSYSNGVHNIGWYAVDNNGDADGFGSRFFEIQNTGGASVLNGRTDASKYGVDTSGRLRISVEGQPVMEAEQLERIKIVLKGEGGNRIIGWGADETKSLPVGSTLDSEDGVFYWSIGPGFLNRHVLHFAVSDGTYRSNPVQVVVNVVPKRFNRLPKKIKIKD
jgi:hypothetical protein